MPRKAFLADVKRLSDGRLFEGLTAITHGEEDGHVIVNATLTPEGSACPLTIIISDVSDYPREHHCFLSAPDNAPSEFAALLERLSHTQSGCSLEDLLRVLSRKLVERSDDGDVIMPDSQKDQSPEDECDDGEDAESVDDFDDRVFGPVTTRSGGGSSSNITNTGVQLGTTATLRMRADLLAAKSAGFKVGVLGNVFDGSTCYVSISCRIAKLGISGEAMRAWQVDRDEYLTLLIQYPDGYKDLAWIGPGHLKHQSKYVNFAVRICNSYKPTLEEAALAFSVVWSESRNREEALAAPATQPRSLRTCFISKALDQLLNQRLLTLIVYRKSGCSWADAEKYYNDHQGSLSEGSDDLKQKSFGPSDTESQVYPAIVNADHLATAFSTERSLPLAAFQFLLRHFVRCSEFCLVCFNKVPDNLGALKPFVCDSPLCLFQYMSLGFGPSIEHEILAQPHVVDLLISLCYVAGRCRDKLNTFPVGLGLKVPPLIAVPPNEALPDRTSTFPPLQNQQKPHSRPKDDPHAKLAAFDATKGELLFDSAKACPVRVGDWIVVTKVDELTTFFHCRIASTSAFPVVSVSKPCIPGSLWSSGPKENNKPASDVPQPSGKAIFYVYDENFDHLTDDEKRKAIVRLLDLLPSVKELRDYIVSTHKDVSTWRDRISPAQAGLLRFIIASSRASIMQIDDLDASEEEQAEREDVRLYGLDGWMQFRFAMGAPDKERRFVDAVQATSAQNQYPTLFAWHGSSIANWHSIIREGLHFRYIACGRAYGDGVYHSLNVETSLSYSTAQHVYGSWQPTAWPRSRLNVANVLVLSEIVNAPSQFVSVTPHLVVQHLDWIQTRFLFVQCNNPNILLPLNTMMPKEALPQDPQYLPRGTGGRALLIPTKVLGRRSGSILTDQDRGAPAADKSQGIGEEDGFRDDASVGTSPEDLDILVDESTNAHASAGSFVPGKLDVTALPLMPPPAFATPAASKRLLGDFRALVKMQEAQPLHRLGWYLNADPDFTNNLFQWIVELHTFDPSLPLAKDMAKRGIFSIVLELRFGKDFPMSPPFVRVIRPRFLGFSQGGGGHVTMGGAICMELLTNNGWTAACTIDSMLMQIKMAMESTDPRPARLAGLQISDYGMHEAVEAFERACRVHGWTVPSDLRETTAGTENPKVVVG